MAVDWRLERFAVDMFLHAENSAGIPFRLQSRRNEYEKGTVSDCTDEINQLVFCRFTLFKFKLMELEEDLELFKSNDVNFIRYIRENMSKYFPYPHMDIFDKIFMSCAVVTKMSHLLYTNKMYRDTASLSWVMYFEAEFKEEFYAVKDCWEALKKYAEESNTCIIKDLKIINQPAETCRTDLEYAEYVRKYSERTYIFRDIIETFKKCIRRPLGSFCCSKCLPLFDALYYLTFEDKLVSDFQLVEGYLQMFFRMWYRDRAKKMFYNMRQRTEYEMSFNAAFSQTQVILSRMFHKRIFKTIDLDNSKVGCCGNGCMFCGEEGKNTLVYLKSIICRTTMGEGENAEGVLDRNEEVRSLRKFLMLGLETAQI